MSDCPCGSGTGYADCCEPLIRGERFAETAEQLMRSRYSAYVHVEMDYLLETLHPDKRDGHDPEGARKWAAESTWHGLEIRNVHDGGSEDDTGEVEFVADFTYEEQRQSHHEEASFARQDDRWYFLDGQPFKQRPFVRDEPKVKRNDPCPCGSGKKYKRCCAQ